VNPNENDEVTMSSSEVDAKVIYDENEGIRE
jgi:hypothetical protein